jgi:hypothetical protein
MENKTFEEQSKIRVPFLEIFGKMTDEDIKKVFNKHGITDEKLIPKLNKHYELVNL